MHHHTENEERAINPSILPVSRPGEFSRVEANEAAGSTPPSLMALASCVVCVLCCVVRCCVCGVVVCGDVVVVVLYGCVVLCVVRHARKNRTCCRYKRRRFETRDGGVSNLHTGGGHRQSPM